MKRARPAAARGFEARSLPRQRARATPAPFDSVPGVGFDTSAAAAAIVPPPGRITGDGPALAVDPGAEQRLSRHQPRVEAGRHGAPRPGAPSPSGQRFVISGLDAAAQSELVTSLALKAERTAAAGAPLKKPRIGLFQPWRGSMDEGWTRWVLEQYGFEPVTLHPEDFKAPLRDRVDVLILADDARIPVEGAQAAGGPATWRDAARHRAWAARPRRVGAARACLCARRCRPAGVRSSSSGAAARSCASTAPRGSRSSSSSCRCKQRRRGPEARGVLPARIDREGRDRSTATR